MTRNQKSMNIDFNIQQLKTEERREERKENEEKMKKEKEKQNGIAIVFSEGEGRSR